MSDNKGCAEVSPYPLLLLLLSLWPLFSSSPLSTSFPTYLLLFFRPYFLLPPPFEFYVASRPPPRRFHFRLLFFVVFVVFIPRADRGVVYMHVLEKIGGFGGFVATGLGRF